MDKIAEDEAAVIDIFNKSQQEKSKGSKSILDDIMSTEGTLDDLDGSEEVPASSSVTSSAANSSSSEVKNPSSATSSERSSKRDRDDNYSSDRNQKKDRDRYRDQDRERDVRYRDSRDRRISDRHSSSSSSSSYRSERENERRSDKAEIERKSSSKTERYFAIKTFSIKHLEISIQKSIWATQAHNERKLNDAFDESTVYLIFSVNNSRHFQGYCKMISRIGKESSNAWTDTEGGQPWGGVFRVEWKKLSDLPFTDTKHLKNPLNEDKEVKICRDGQELPSDIGRELCDMFDKLPASDEKSRQATIDKAAASSNNGNGNNKRQRDDRGYRDRSPPRDRGDSRYPKSSSSSRYSRRSPSPRSRRTDRYKPIDLLNMTYEDYLKVLNEKAHESWSQYAAAYGMSQDQYLNYMAWMAKNPHAYYYNGFGGNSSASSSSSSSSNRRSEGGSSYSSSGSSSKRSRK
eukprot:TRINITY_DN8254_c0_g2_i2.p1 TRINITY_DN8254_c0_g2~~TRINITY_DN8254_c0_g2_i2.p1  ORF type:complete len:486 (+),score=90.93 TRINITY_DN8254_c0_g2_i2:78-1460(+)